MQNAAVAAQLRQIADILDYQGVQFKPAAYRRAAQTVEDLPHDIAELTDRTSLKALPGIGDAIADKILEFLATGKMSFLTQLQAETQSGAAGLLAVDDLGPKRVRELEQKLGIRTVAELIDAAKKGKLRTLPRFSELLEKKILESALRAGDRVQRFPLKDVEYDVEAVLKALRTLPNVEEVEAAGSYRRHKETVGDIDILIAVKKPSEKLAQGIEERIRKLPIVERVVAGGHTRIAFDLKSKLRVDIRIVGLNEWGSALLYFTGSKEHNISLRRRAIDRGMKLNEYALTQGESVVASRTEQEIYDALDLPFIPPQERTAELPD
jgi:DNA polymerase (family X)